MAVTEEEKKRNSTVEISGLRFTYPGIDGHPPPGSKPLIEDFSITLNSSDRCLLVGSNGAGILKFHISLARNVCVLDLNVIR